MQLLSKKRRFDSSDILPMFALGTLGLQILILFLTLAIATGTWAVARKPSPSMVQLDNGRSIAMEPVDHFSRTPVTVHQFVKNGLGMLFTWNAKLTSKNGAGATGQASRGSLSDPGVQVGRGRITTGTWQASFMVAEDFRNPFLQEVAKMTPNGVFSNAAQSVLSFESVSDPKPVKPGIWQVDVVANLLIFDGANPQGRVIPFNKSVFVQAVEPTSDPLPENSTPIQQAVYQAQQSGLRITEMRDLEIQQLTR
ncbi:hypothetical protein AB3R30_20860 [Leptolyngbyaceae cyanobacterium UHCC 1019]